MNQLSTLIPLILKISTYQCKLTMNDDLIPLEGTQLTNASFRQGCPVYVVGCEGSSNPRSLPRIQNRGNISNVFLKLAELIQTSSRCNMLFELSLDFEVAGLGSGSTSGMGPKRSTMVTADRLRFQNGCPVNVKLQSSGDNNGELARGIVLGWCDIPFDDDHRKYTSDTFWYSVQIIHNERHNSRRDFDWGTDRSEGKEANKENMEDYAYDGGGEGDEVQSDVSEEFVPMIMHQISPKDISYRVDVEEEGVNVEKPSLHQSSQPREEPTLQFERAGDRVCTAVVPDEISSSIPISISIPEPSSQVSSLNDANYAKIKNEPEVTSTLGDDDGPICDNDNSGDAAFGSAQEHVHPIIERLRDSKIARAMKQSEVPSNVDAGMDTTASLSEHERLQNRLTQPSGKLDNGSSEAPPYGDEGMLVNQQQQLRLNESAGICNDGSVKKTGTPCVEVRAPASDVNKENPLGTEKDNDVGVKRSLPADIGELSSGGNMPAKRVRTAETEKSQGIEGASPTPDSHVEGNTSSNKLSGDNEGACIGRTSYGNCGSSKMSISDDSAHDSNEANKGSIERNDSSDLQNQGNAYGCTQLDDMGRIPRKSRPIDYEISHHQKGQDEKQKDDHHDDRRDPIPHKPPLTKKRERRGNRVDNPKYRKDIFEFWSDRKTFYSIRDVKSMVLDNPIPRSQLNPSISMCLSYHVRGFCSKMCKCAEDHQPLTAYQYHNLARWYKRNCSKVEFVGSSSSSSESEDSESENNSESDNEGLKYWHIDLTSLRVNDIKRKCSFVRTKFLFYNANKSLYP